MRSKFKGSQMSSRSPCAFHAAFVCIMLVRGRDASAAYAARTLRYVSDALDSHGVTRTLGRVFMYSSMTWRNTAGSGWLAKQCAVTVTGAAPAKAFDGSNNRRNVAR